MLPTRLVFRSGVRSGPPGRQWCPPPECPPPECAPPECPPWPAAWCAAPAAADATAWETPLNADHTAVVFEVRGAAARAQVDPLSRPTRPTRLRALQPAKPG